MTAEKVCGGTSASLKPQSAGVSVVMLFDRTLNVLSAPSGGVSAKAGMAKAATVTASRVKPVRRRQATEYRLADGWERDV